jgi:hypothetical protein
LFLLSGTLFARDVTGTVYSDHSGPSGSGTGMVRIATGSRIIAIHYQKPIEAKFSGDGCRDVGAIWTVQVDDTKRVLPDTVELVRARCDGHFDVPVHSAWMAVRDYSKQVAENAGQTTGFQIGRRGPINVKLGQYEIDVDGYISFSPGGACLEMKELVNRATAIVESSADCYFKLGSEYPDVEFTVRHELSGWSVASVDILGRAK